MKITVQTKSEICEDFSKRKIVESLIEETEVEEEEANRIARSVKYQLDQAGVKTVTTGQVRELIVSQLLKRGEKEEANLYETIGIPVSEITQIINQRQNDNANSSFNPESVAKYSSDYIYKQYALTHLLESVQAKAHMRGDTHIHDLNYFPTRLNCISHDPRFFFQKGLAVDGNSTQTVYAKPAKSISAVINWLGQIMGTGQCHFGGAQGMTMINMFLAPFTIGLSDQDLKQAIQSFIFNLGLSYVSRGGEIIFSNLNIELCGVPPFMLDSPAIGPEGKQVGLYGDYIDEAQRVASVFIDVLIEGDGYGHFHLMPNTAFALRKSAEKDLKYQELVLKAHELAAKFPTPYFLNMDIEGEGGHNCTWGCRSTLASNWTGNPEIDTLRCGNTSFVTLNLPRYAFLTKDEDQFFDYLNQNMNIAKEIMILRADIFKTNRENGMMNFLNQKGIDGEPYYKLENGTYSFGNIGFEEVLRNLNIEGLSTKDGQKYTVKVLDFINEKVSVLKEETGLRFSHIGSPAETTAGRLATIDKNKLGVKNVMGNEDGYYYSNSTHLRVDEDIDILERIKIEAPLHKLVGGGAIYHAWLSEKPEPEAIMGLSKVLKKYEARYWTFTNDYTVCNKCKKSFNGIVDICPLCGSLKTSSYSKISGYVQKIDNWNKSKRRELIDRYRYNV